MYVNCNNLVHAFHLLAVASSGVSSKNASGQYSIIIIILMQFNYKNNYFYKINVRVLHAKCILSHTIY